ncbi:MAG: deoxyribodipyrimidine photo-lyase, partial [Saprospiraceae bacterium]
MTTISIFWFRRDFRLHDNRGLYEALMHGDPVLCIFIFDTNILDSLKDKNDRRVSFIHESLTLINTQLASFGSTLLTYHDNPENAFSQLTEKFQIKNVFTNHDYEPYAIDRDADIEKLLTKKKIAFHSFKDQVFFEKSEITKSDQTPYTIFTPYSKIWKEKYNAEQQKNY